MMLSYVREMCECGYYIMYAIAQQRRQQQHQQQMKKVRIVKFIKHTVKNSRTQSQTRRSGGDWRKAGQRCRSISRWWWLLCILYLCYACLLYMYYYYWIGWAAWRRSGRIWFFVHVLYIYITCPLRLNGRRWCGGIMDMYIIPKYGCMKGDGLPDCGSSLRSGSRPMPTPVEQITVWWGRVVAHIHLIRRKRKWSVYSSYARRLSTLLGHSNSFLNTSIARMHSHVLTEEWLKTKKRFANQNYSHIL